MLPRLVPLAEQAGRFGGGEGARAAPFALTAAIAAALFILALIAARRIES